MQNFLKPCNVFSKWEGEFMWFTTAFFTPKPKLCLHHSGTYHFTLLLWAFFSTVLPHRTCAELDSFLSGTHWEWIMLCKTLLSYTHRGHWWASSTSADSVVKGTEVTVMSDQSCQARGRSLPIHLAEAGGIPQVIKSFLPQLSSHQTRLLHSVSSSNFFIKFLSFVGMHFFKC